MNKSVQVLQNGYKDCGPACLLSIIKHYGGNASHEEIALLLKTDVNGTTAYNLIKGAEELGFNGYGIKYSFEEIISSHVSFPIIAHILKDNMYHYVVVYGFNANKLLIMDPSEGNIKMSYDNFKKMYLGTSIVLYPAKKLLSINNLKSITSYFKEYLYVERKNLFMFMLLSLLVILLSILSTFYMKILIDNIIPNVLYKELVIISYLFLNILFFKSLLNFLKGRYLIKLTSKIGVKLNNETIRHFFNLPYQFFKNKSTGEVISRVSDIKNLKDLLSSIIVNLSMDIILITISIIVLFLINIKLSIITILFVFLYYIIVRIYSKIFKKNINEFQTKDCEYNKILTETIEGYETNKNINMLNSIVKKIETKYIIYTQKYIKFESSIINQTYIKDVLMNINYILTMFLGTKYIMNGTISLGNFLIFNSLLSYFVEPIKDILDFEPNMNYIKNIYSRINDLIIMKDKRIEDTTKMIKGDILFDRISYCYNGFKRNIENVSLNIKYGSKYLIYGKSGYGKSTMLKILLKYLNGYEGSIMINNQNLKDIDDSIIASSFTYVSQNNYLNNDTLINNIIYDRDISNEKYEQIIKICHVDRIRDTKELRNSFLIEDNGFNLSGGERQKIILARALLKESNFIILDEALSEVGVSEEKEIINKIIKHFSDKTIIFVTHKKEIISMFENKYYLERRKHD